MCYSYSLDYKNLIKKTRPCVDAFVANLRGLSPMKECRDCLAYRWMQVTRLANSYRGQLIISLLFTMKKRDNHRSDQGIQENRQCHV